MIDYSQFKHDPLSEQITDIICSKVGTDERTFFRVNIAYYFSMVATSMRTMILQPGNMNTGQPVNMYAVNLAPSGFGKGYSTGIMEDQVINKFREAFLDKTWPTMVMHNLAKVADYRARKDQKDPEATRIRVEKEFERLGEYEFVFDKPTEPAVKQLRNLLLMSKVGAINLQIDEIGSNLFKAKDALPAFLELYDGKLKNNLTKNTQESIRGAALYGITPANMMLFGVPSALLDNGKNEIEFAEMLEHGYARRCFFGYVSDEQFALELKFLSPAEQLRRDKMADTDTALEGIAEQLELLADPLKANTKLSIPDDVALVLYQYRNDCKQRAFELPVQNNVAKYEMEHRHAKARKLAGAYAFINGASQVEMVHVESAIALAEESGNAFSRIMHRELPHVKLAKHLGNATQELTKVSLREQLPFFKSGSKQNRDEMLSEAIDWGYTNNIAIKRRFSNGVEFYSGDLLKSNDLTKLRISWSGEFTENYRSAEIPWSQMDRLAKHDNVHWINHHLVNGFDGVGYRDNDHCIAGFNMVVIDVDGGLTIQSAQKVLEDYKAFYYVTKRHSASCHRFRIILPISHTLELNAEDFAGFMKNLYEWLPFDSDEQTGQRARKWLSNKGHSAFTQGKLLDPLPFIPRTIMQHKYSDRLIDLADMGGLERWFLLNTSIDAKNRNNNMIRYGLMLVDAGMDVVGARDKILAMNSQIDVPIEPDEIDSSIMLTVSKRVQLRAP